ncbi:MAG: sterol desaturase family protein [Bacteriovoracaceae bacterium]|nr:sterol desaturase family protein [Bacteriovoracaceae bacterium]
MIGILWQLGLSKIYLNFNMLSIYYLPLSFLIYALAHEFYFYFTHVWMHRPRVYRNVHAVHHQSIKTTPFASFSFHPLEALVHAAFLPIMVMLIPIHPVVIIGYLIFMTVTAISNHLGVEVITSSHIKKHFISGEHHAKHHRLMKYNFGLYFTFMDRLMGTEADALKSHKLKRAYE